MKYKKQSFVDNQTLEAKHLNHMEDGIEANAEELEKKLTGSIEEDGDPVTLVTEEDLNNAVAELEGKMTAITDEGGYFASENIEGALQEIGAELSGINTLLGTGVLE